MIDKMPFIPMYQIVLAWILLVILCIFLFLLKHHEYKCSLNDEESKRVKDNDSTYP